MKFYKIGLKNFSIKNSFLKTEFNFTKKELRDLNNEIKKPWIRPGWDKIVN